MSTTEAPIDDRIFDALADVHRRQLLLELLYRDRQSIARLTGTGRELADADDGLLREHLSGPRRVPGADEEVVRFHRVHLPKLAAYGFIEWDRDDHVVTKGPRFEDLRPFLEVVASRRDDRPPGVLEMPVRRTR